MDAKFCATSNEQPNSGCRRRAIMSTRGVMKGEQFAVMRHAILKRTIRASRIWRTEPESNRSIRICSLLRHKRSEEHRSELQSLMRISYDVLFLKQNKSNESTET